MPLTLRPNITSASRHFDHLVMSGELCVGRIYKREPANSPETQWLWAIRVGLVVESCTIPHRSGPARASGILADWRAFISAMTQSSQVALSAASTRQ